MDRFRARCSLMASYREPERPSESAPAIPLHPQHAWLHAQALADLEVACARRRDVLVVLAVAGTLASGVALSAGHPSFAAPLAACALAACVGAVWALRAHRALRAVPTAIVGLMGLHSNGWGIEAGGRRYALYPREQRRTFQQPGPVHAWVLSELHAAIAWQPQRIEWISQQEVIDRRFGVRGADRDTLRAGLVPSRLVRRAGFASLRLVALVLVALAASVALAAAYAWTLAITLPACIGLAAHATLRVRESQRDEVDVHVGSMWAGEKHAYFLPVGAPRALEVRGFHAPHERLETGTDVRAFFLRGTQRLVWLELLSPSEVDRPSER